MVRALLRESHECDYGFNVPGGFGSCGYLDLSSAASSDWVFTRQRILHFLQLFERSSSLTKSAIILGSLQSRRSPRVRLPTSFAFHGAIGELSFGTFVRCVKELIEN